MAPEFFYIIAIVFLTYWSGFFSGSEIALFSLPSTTIRSYQTSSNYRKKLIAKLLNQPRDLLVTIYMVNTLVNILLQNVSSSMFGTASGWVLKVGVPLLITLLLGEILPKYLSLQRNTAISYKVIPTINFFTNLLRPIREWTVKITTPISRVMFFFLKKESAITKDELNHVLTTSQKTGVLSNDEGQLIYGYINLQDSQVKEHMKPRDDVIFFNLQEPLTKLIYLFVDQECTRIPVCDNGLDNVKGVLSANDFFIYKPVLEKSEDLLPIIHKPFFLPESTPARLLLRRLQEKHEKLALVVDEHRSVTGVISIEDIVEEVVGEIQDLRDQPPLYEQPNKNTIIASGRLELSTLEEIWSIELQSKYNMNTIGGWLTEKIGDIPKTGTEYHFNGLHFQILSADESRVKKIYITKKSERGGS